MRTSIEKVYEILPEQVIGGSIKTKLAICDDQPGECFRLAAPL